ncbi:enoyl-CoA hydratase-related protein [Profundibacterium mesophilum]|uniref:3-hydroxyacyl-CoA dehydrogenase n=1 Tax=Profundibacterium mesophilum KAUST100406-0324 TaxID=1037889 RepID=A0A921NQ40_9RHOB|nr:enoyl-CoA hydratase-related protein [Profundibacterium mesophilum]KAF0675017.1 3-hydroxyacyl-CoA dehydrogenase [Profundibacterium mesophilum KAUST100406-0324]
MTLPEYRITESGTALITFGRPSGNALSGALVFGIAAQIARAIDDTSAKAIVLTGAGANFSAGVDLGAMQDEAAMAALGTLGDAIENSPKPVVAALRGMVAGPAFELALAAAGRVAEPEASMSMPHIAFGMIPGAGGTQRLPRLVGAQAALDMILGGRPRRARLAPEGLVDLLSEDPVEAAERLALQIVQADDDDTPTGRRRHAELDDPAGFVRAVNAARARPAHLPAQRHVIDCIEAVLLLPEGAGFAMERAYWRDCRDSDGSRALRRLARAEAAAGRVPEVAGGPPPRLPRKVGVVGGTARCAELAIACLDAGIETILVGVDTSGLIEVGDAIMARYDGAVAAGRMSPATRDERLSLLTPSEEFEALGEADLVIEEAANDRMLRREVIAAIALFVPQQTLIATGSDLFGPDELAEVTERPARTLVFRMHGRGMRLVELAAGADVPGAVKASASLLVRRLGRLPLWCGPAPGLLVARLREAELVALEAMLLRGTPPERIDAALQAFGRRQGPCRALDAEGLAARLSERLDRPQDRERAAGSLLAELVEAGRTGGSAGGFYPPEGAAPVPLEDGTMPAPGASDPAALAVIDAHRRARGIARDPLSQAGIRAFWNAALANAGAHLIESGAAAGPGAVDVAAVHGLDYPRWQGGPLFAADLEGLLRVRNVLRQQGGSDPAFVPHPLFDTLIGSGRTFADL